MFSWLFKNRENDIPEPPYSYQYINYLREEEYPAHLKKLYEFATGEKLNLKNPKTFNEKIQWMKLYEKSEFKRKLTENIAMMEYAKEKIGEEYIPKQYQICESFEEIDFEKLPNSFIIKTNHSHIWSFYIKNKEELKNNDKLMTYIEDLINNWARLSYFPQSALDKNFIDLDRKIIIEEDTNPHNTMSALCINGKVIVLQRIKKENKTLITTSYDSNYQIIPNFKYNDRMIVENQEFPEEFKYVIELSEKIAQNINLVLINWTINNSKLYFDSLNFSPYKGFCKFSDETWNKKLGEMIKIK